MTEKIVHESLETWSGGKANAYYEPYTNEIHILTAKDMEFRCLVHEKIHAFRKNKTTYALASLMQFPQVKNLLFGLFLALSAFGVGVQALNPNILALVPAFFVAATFTFLLGCAAYEEYIADATVAKSCKEIRCNGENLPDE